MIGKLILLDALEFLPVLVLNLKYRKLQKSTCKLLQHTTELQSLKNKNNRELAIIIYGETEI